MKPLVTIITPYRNSLKFIPRFVSSMQSQTWNDWNCIMVDDDSTDNGPLKLQQIVTCDPRFRLYKNTNLKSGPGPASARNYALDYVDSPLVAFCDVDDLWHPRKLEMQISFHLSNDLDLSVTAYGRFINGKLAEPLKALVCPPANLDLANLRGRNPIPMLTAMISTDLARHRFEQVPHEDFLFWLEIFRSNPTIRYGCIPTVLAYYCIHRDNLTASKAIMPIWVYRVFREFGDSRLSSIHYVNRWISAHMHTQFRSCFKTKPNHASLLYLLGAPPLLLTQDGSSLG